MAGLYIPESVACPGAVKSLHSYLDFLADQTINQPIEDVKKIPSKNRNLVQHLALLGLSRKELRDQLIAVILAAKDPTAITLAWTCYELARNPSVFNEMRKEVESQ